MPTTPAITSAHVGPFAKPTEQQALAQVLPDLQAILTADPATHAELLEQLGQTEPAMWPALTERAQSTLAYRNQLAGKKAIPSTTQLASHNALVTSPPAAAPVPAAPLPTRLPAAVAAQMPVTQMPTVTQATTAPPAEHRVAAAAQPFVVSPAGLASQPQVIENQHAVTPTVQPAVVSANDTGGEVRLVTGTTEPSATQLDEPKSTMPHADWHTLLDTTITTLDASLPEKPHSSAEAYDYARLRLLRLAAGARSAVGSPNGAISAVPGLSTTEQGFWSKQLFSLATLMDVTRQPDRKQRAAAAALHQAEALDQLRQLGAIQVRNLTFCSEAYGFGAYEPLKETGFRPGDQASLYAEVDNYRSESTDRGYHTSIATSYRVEDKSGGLVDEGEFPLVDDYCLSRRRDFHITYGVTLPTAIYPGEYLLRLTITDQLGDKIGEDTLPFTIVAP